MKSVFLLCVIYIFDTCSANDPVQAKFGCKFDSNYNLPGPKTGKRVHIKAAPTPLVDVENHLKPVWGEGNVGIASFKDEDQLINFVVALEKVNAGVVQGTLYDTIDNLLTFYDDFKKFEKEGHSTRALNLNEFFIQYEETKKPSDGASLTIEMTKRMIAQNPQFVDKMLAASLSTCVTGDFGNLTENQLSVEPHLLPVKNYNDRVMGFIRVKIGRKKMGYVVMDPANALMNIVIIMDSESNLAQVTTGKTEDPTKDGKFWHKYRRLGHYIDTTSSQQLTFGDSKRTLCYVGRSFCSHENASRKPALVKPFHSMVIFNNKWIVQGELLVELYETDKYNGRILLWGTNTENEPTVLKFENIKQLFEQLQVDQNRKKVNEVGKAFGKTPRNMDELLTRIGIMFQDRVFMFQMKRLNDWFSKDTAKHYRVD